MLARKIIRAITLALAAAAGLSGQTIPGRYVLELSGEPAALASSRAGGRPAEFAARRGAVRAAQAEAKRQVVTHGGIVIESLDTVFNGLIIEIPEARAAELMQIPRAVKLHTARHLYKSLDHALALHKITDAWNLLPLGPPVAGSGMKIAIVDTGIDVQHPGFSGVLPALDGFPKLMSDADSPFANAKIVVVRNYTTLNREGNRDPDADDRDGHGTGTAMVAAGGPAASPYGWLTGAAPMAYLGNYKVFGPRGTAQTDVLVKAIDDAVADGMDVINLSLGSYVASFSQLDPNDVMMAAIARAANAGVIVTVAAGNDGPATGTISDLGSSPDVITVGAVHNDRSLGSAITVAGGGTYRAFVGDGPNPGQVVSGTLLDVATVDATSLACSPLPPGSATGRVALARRGDCTFETKLINLDSAGAIAAIIYNNPDSNPFSPGGVTVGTAALPALFVNQAEGGGLKTNVSTIDGARAALDFSGAISLAERPDVASFSSRGPSVGSALKPDLVAVGQEIATAAQRNFPGGESFSTSGFIDAWGTSFSTPLLAGAAAILKSARPGLNASDYRSLLINTASLATLAEGQNATISQAGAGVLNLAAALVGTVTAYPTSLNLGTGTALNASQLLTLANIGTASETYRLRVLPAISGTTAPLLSKDALSLDGGTSGQIAVSVDGQDLAPGEYSGFLEIAGTASGKIARVPYWFAVPGQTPAGISVLHQDWSDSRQSLAVGAVLFRIVDAAGLPYTGQDAPVVTGANTVRSYRVGTIPATYAVDIRTGIVTVQVDIVVGELRQTVVIPVN